MRRKHLLVLGLVGLIAVAVFFVLYVPVVASGSDNDNASINDATFNLEASAEVKGYSLLTGASIQYRALLIDGRQASSITVSVTIFGIAIGIASASAEISVILHVGVDDVIIDKYATELDLTKTVMHRSERTYRNNTIYDKLLQARKQPNVEYSYVLRVDVAVTVVGAETGNTYELYLHAEPLSGTLKLVYESFEADINNSTSTDMGTDTGSDITDDSDIVDMPYSVLGGIGLLALLALAFVTGAVLFNPQYRKKLGKAVKKFAG